MKRSRGLVGNTLLSRLFERETTSPPGGASASRFRRWYEIFVPSCPVPAIPRPQVGSYIFKFTPCGRFLISFDVGSQGVEVVLHSYKGLQTDSSPQISEPRPAVRFEDVFDLHIRCDVTSGPEEHLLAFALVVYNDFLILASITPEVQNLDGEGDGRWLGVSEAVTLHSVDMMSGQVLDRVLLKVDSAHLTNQAAVSVWDDIIAILAPDLQNVYIVRISIQGKFEDVRTIGSWCYEDDEQMVRAHEGEAIATDNTRESSHAASSSDDSHNVEGPDRRRRRIFTEASPSLRADRHDTPVEEGGVDRSADSPIFYGCLKQRLLAKLHQQALNQGNHMTNAPSSTALGFFYYFFAVYAEFEIHGVSLVDRDRLLLRWMPPRPGGAQRRMLEHAAMPGDGRDNLRRPSATLVKGVYTLYNIVTTQIEALFKDSSPELTEWLMATPSAIFGGRPANDWEQFLLPSLWGHSSMMVQAVSNSLILPGTDPPSGPAPSPSGRTIAMLHLEGCQTHQTSPYLDNELYQMDERAATKNLVPRPFPRRPLKFIARTWPERLRFKFDPTDILHDSATSRRRASEGGAGSDVDMETEVDAVVSRHAEVIYLFHPHQPFAMTIVQNSETGIAEHLIFYTHDRSFADSSRIE